MHHTFLLPDGGGKSSIEPARASLGPVAGCAVILQDEIVDALLVIGEGIETSLSAAALLGGFAWAAVSDGNLTALPMPAPPACPVLLRVRRAPQGMNG